jgi:uncharacterized membrane protein
MAEAEARVVSESAGASRKERVASVDLLRGIVIVVMALDHVRDYFTDVSFSATDLSRTTPTLFFTRWITHFCAPVFVFLAGTGASLSVASGKPKKEAAKFLVTRGLWLVLLELTVVRFGWMFNLDYRFLVGQVIWAIGWSMVLLAPAVFLPRRVLLALSLVIIVGHNALDSFSADRAGSLRWLFAILHQQGPLPLPFGRTFMVAYPLVPWIGVMGAGYVFGDVIRMPKEPRRRALLAIGLSATLAFFVVRGINHYGDPSPWKTQPDALYTALSFLNCTKYPPSLDYLLMTLGPAILLLLPLERASGPLARAFLVMGKVPLFFYLIHLPVIHGLAVVVAWAHRGQLFPSLFGKAGFPFGIPPAYGYGLAVVYAIWIGVVLALYLPARWFAGVKARRPGEWVSYL